MKNIIVAHDGSDASNRALLMGASIAEKFGAGLTVVSAIPNLCFLGVPVDCASVGEVYRAEAEGILEGVGNALKEKGISAETVILEGSPADVIVDYAKERSADMIVVGSTGKHATKRTILGRISSKIAAHAPCPVLVVR